MIEKHIKNVTNFLWQSVFGICIISFLVTGGCASSKAADARTAEELLQEAEIKLEKGKTEDALFLLEQIVYNYRAFEGREKAAFLIVQAYNKSKDYVLAVAEGRDFLQDYPGSDLADDVQLLIGNALYEQSPSYELDQSTTREAVIEFNTFLQNYPESEHRTTVDKKLKESVNKLAKKEYKNGLFYKKMRMFDASIVYFETVMSYYPDSDWADDTLYALGEVYYEQQKMGEASDSLNRLLESFPKSKWADDAQEMLSEISNWSGN